MASCHGYDMLLCILYITMGMPSCYGNSKKIEYPWLSTPLKGTLIERLSYCKSLQSGIASTSYVIQSEDSEIPSGRC